MVWQVSVVLGSHICFSSALVGVKGEAGKWSAATSEEGEDGILSINPDSGVALSQSPGRTTVTYRVSPGVITTTDVTILPITWVTVVVNWYSYPSFPLNMITFHIQ